MALTVSALASAAVHLSPARLPQGLSGGARRDTIAESDASKSGSAGSATDRADEGAEAAVRGERAERQSSPDGLTAKERRIVAELQRIDRQVRAHEQAHLAAAAGLARGVSFRFATGPNGRRYAVAGEVRIDTAPVEGRPDATIRKAQQIRAAANAPANPSAQDRAVAAQAAAMEAQARQELFAERRQALQQQIRQTQAKSFEEKGVSTSVNFSVTG